MALVPAPLDLNGIDVFVCFEPFLFDVAFRMGRCADPDPPTLARVCARAMRSHSPGVVVCSRRRRCFSLFWSSLAERFSEPTDESDAVVRVSDQACSVSADRSAAAERCARAFAWSEMNPRCGRAPEWWAEVCACSRYDVAGRSGGSRRCPPPAPTLGHTRYAWTGSLE